MRLPFEIVFLIIEHVRHDPETLRACCLLCWGCVDVCQRLLFERARVILATVDRVHEMRQFLDHHLALAAYITALDVDAKTARALHFIHGRLPELRTITAKDCLPRSTHSWTTMEPEPLASFARSCPSLQELRLHDIQLERTLLKAEPQAIEVPVRKLVMTQTRAHLNPLRGLTKELVFKFPCLDTTHLTLSSLSSSDEVAIRQFLRECPSMRELRLDLPELRVSMDGHLGSHENLTRLQLSQVANDATLWKLRSIFNKGRFPSLKEVSLDITGFSRGSPVLPFHPFRYMGYSAFRRAREWILPPRITSRLTAVALSFENLPAVHDMHRLLDVLGKLDRDSVLTVAWNGVRLCPGAYGQDVLDDQTVRATLLQCTCPAH